MKCKTETKSKRARFSDAIQNVSSVSSFCFQLSQKEQQVRAYQEKVNREDHKEHFTNQQLEDRLRHYEAQAQLVDTLQRELSSAQVVVQLCLHFCGLFLDKSRYGSCSFSFSDSSSALCSFKVSLQHILVAQQERSTMAYSGQFSVYLKGDR